MSLIPRRSRSIKGADPIGDFDDFFSHFLVPMKNWSHHRSEFSSPQVDITETDQAVKIKANLPGVKKEDVHVSFDDNILTIEAEMEQEKEETEKGEVIRRERHYGKYSRSFTLGNQFATTDTSAEFKNGVLKLTIPKNKPEPVAATKIEIK